MIKKLLPVLIISISTMAVAFFLMPEKAEKKAKLIQGPGYFEQFRQMRLGELSEYPSGLYKLWSDNKFSKKSIDVIDSINEIGPYNVGGRTRAVLIDKMNPNRLIAGGISGGIWISENRGIKWNRVNDHEINMNVTCITQDEFDPAFIFYGTGEGAGNSSAAPGAGIFRSTDGGSSFSQLPATANPDFEYCWSLKSSLKNGGELYVTTNARGVFRSQDYGNTWKKVYATTGVVHDVETFPDGSVMIALKNIGIYKSYTGDSGTFFKLSGLPVSGIGRVEIAYCLQKPNVVYAGLSNTGDASFNSLYRSNDTGNTWTIKTNPNSAVNFAFTWYCLTLAVRNNDPERLVIGSVNLGYSSNGGQSWIAAGSSHADNHTVAQHPSDTNSFLLGNDGGVYQYQWLNPFSVSNYNNGLNITQFYHGSYAPTGTTVIGGTQDNGSHYSLNAVPSFKKLYGADGAYAQINQQNPSIGYVSTQNGNILRSKNMHGASPSFSEIKNQLDADNNNSIDEGAWFINPYFINPGNGSQLYFPTKRRLWRSVDGGDNWVKVTKLINAGLAEPYSVGLSSDTNRSPMAYIGGASGLFYRVNYVLTDTPGMEKNLKLLASTPLAVKTSFISCIRVHPRYRGTVFISLSNYSDSCRLWKITNADTDTPTWSRLGNGLPRMLPVGSFDLHPDNPDSIIFAGTDFGLYVTTDAGQTWEKDLRVPNVVIDELTIRKTDRKAFIFTHGRGVWIAHLKTMPNPFLSAKSPEKTVQVKVYPNPSSEWVKLTLPQGNANYKLRIYNLEGRLVQETKVEGEEKIDISMLPSGIYLFSVKGESGNYTCKVIKN